MDVKGKKARRRARGDDGDLQGVFAAQTTVPRQPCASSLLGRFEGVLSLICLVVRDFLVHVAL